MNPTEILNIEGVCMKNSTLFHITGWSILRVWYLWNSWDQQTCWELLRG